MIEIELRKQRNGLGAIVEYATLWCPLTTPQDFGCSKPGLLSFEDACELADRITAGERSGEFHGFMWQIIGTSAA